MVPYLEQPTPCVQYILPVPTVLQPKTAHNALPAQAAGPCRFDGQGRGTKKRASSRCPRLPIGSRLEKEAEPGNQITETRPHRGRAALSGHPAMVRGEPIISTPTLHKNTLF